MISSNPARTLFFALAAPLLSAALWGAQSRPGPTPARPAQDSKSRDRLKSQLRRRYGTSAIPDKTDPKKPAAPDKTSQPPAKN